MKEMLKIFRNLIFFEKVSAFIKNAQVLKQICAFFYLLFHKNDVLSWSDDNL